PDADLDDHDADAVRLAAAAHDADARPLRPIRGRAFFVSTTMDDDLDDLIRRVDPDRWRSSRFIGDVGRRADVIALYAYDYELARAPRVASNPLLAEIRLT